MVINYNYCLWVVYYVAYNNIEIHKGYVSSCWLVSSDLEVRDEKTWYALAIVTKDKHCHYNIHISIHAYTRIGPCINRTTMDAQVTCDEDGNFDPLQCRRMNDGTRTCYCVFPGNGSMVAGTMRTGIREREDAPDCVARGIMLCSCQ